MTEPVLHRPRVYGASASRLHSVWRHLAKNSDWSFVEWTSTWPFEDIDKQDELSPAEFGALWAKNLLQIRDSDFILVLGSEDLRGALVEVGCALTERVRVVTAGVHRAHSWAYHPLVTRCGNLDYARNHLYKYITMVPKRSKASATDTQ